MQRRAPGGMRPATGAAAASSSPYDAGWKPRQPLRACGRDRRDPQSEAPRPSAWRKRLLQRRRAACRRRPAVGLRGFVNVIALLAAGKRVATVPAVAYGECKDASEAWTTGVLTCSSHRTSDRTRSIIRLSLRRPVLAMGMRRQVAMHMGRNTMMFLAGCVKRIHVDEALARWGT